MLPARRDSAKYRFDELKINFLARYGGDAVKSILYVGISRGDGASTVAFKFAKSLAEDADARVLLINADLRAPWSAFNMTDPAQTSGRRGVVHWRPGAPLPTVQGNLDVLPGGRGYVDPAVLFPSKRFSTFMAQMAQKFDYVVVDGPPLDEAPESIALSTQVDGVILVINAQRTRRKIALRAKQQIGEVGGKLLGVVLNRRKYYVPSWLYKRL
jgi:capsular exopolysaccharide synthesis family protein